MNKIKYILIFFVMLTGVSSHSQVLLSVIFGDKLNSEGLEFGLERGINWSTISTLDADKSLSSFNLGFYFDFKLKSTEKIKYRIRKKYLYIINSLSYSKLFLEWERYCLSYNSADGAQKMY